MTYRLVSAALFVFFFILLWIAVDSQRNKQKRQSSKSSNQDDSLCEKNSGIQSEYISDYIDRTRQGTEMSATRRKIAEESMAAADERKRFIGEQRRLVTDSMRYDVLKRDGFHCRICGATADDGVKLHVDHIVPVSKGGLTEMTNLRTLCERCNRGKSDKLE